MRSLEDIIREVCREDPRYKAQAYYFIYEALDFTQKRLNCVGHISGGQLMEGVRQLAIERFGMMALRVFREWGMTSTGDFGQVVFNLVNKKAMGKTADDDASDFVGLYDFESAFDDSEVVKEQWKIDD